MQNSEGSKHKMIMGLGVGTLVGCCGGGAVIGAVAGTVSSISAGATIGIAIGLGAAGAIAGGGTCWLGCWTYTKLKACCSSNQTKKQPHPSSHCCQIRENNTSSHASVMQTLPKTACLGVSDTDETSDVEFEVETFEPDEQSEETDLEDNSSSLSEATISQEASAQSDDEVPHIQMRTM